MSSGGKLAKDDAGCERRAGRAALSMEPLKRTADCDSVCVRGLRRSLRFQRHARPKNLSFAHQAQMEETMRAARFFIPRRTFGFFLAARRRRASSIGAGARSSAHRRAFCRRRPGMIRVMSHHGCRRSTVICLSSSLARKVTRAARPRPLVCANRGSRLPPCPAATRRGSRRDCRWCPKPHSSVLL